MEVEQVVGFFFLSRDCINTDRFAHSELGPRRARRISDKAVRYRSKGRRRRGKKGK